MSETTLFDDGWTSFELDEELYPQDSVRGAAYALLERAYVFLERAADKRIRVRVKAKSGDSAALAGELENEALAQAYRRRIAGGRRALIEGVTARAIAGAAGPPGLDDLLDMDIGAETAFDDPLGIAMSWEEKYTKKKGEKASDGAPSVAAAPSAAAAPPAAATPPAAASLASDPARSAEPAPPAESHEPGSDEKKPV
jgi:His-Xaa-Ser system protein HxsD